MPNIFNWKIDSIAKTFLFSIFFVILIISTISGIYWIYKKYEFFHTESNKIKEDYINSQKNLLRQEIDKLLSHIDYEKKLVQKEFDDLLKSSVFRAYDITSIIYERLKKDLTDENIQKEIFFVLKKKFPGSNLYLFKTKNDFKIILFNIDKKFQNRSLTNIKNKKDNFPLINLALAVNEQKELFYDFSLKYKNKEKEYHSFNKLFSPYNWNIGFAVEKERVEKAITDKVVSTLVEAQKENKFLCNISLLELYDINGGKNFAKFLIYKSKPQLKQLFISDSVKDSKGIEYAKKYLKDLKEKRESFFIQNIKTKEGEDAAKLIYYKLYPELNWIVGGTICLAHLEKSIKHQEKLLREYIIIKILKFVAIFILAMILAFFLAKLYSAKIQKNFSSFNQFFKEAAKNFKKINPDKFYFKEFKEMAKSANSMISEYEKAKKELQFSQEYLKLMLDTQQSLVVVTDSNLISANKSFYEFLGFKDYKDFIKNHDCVCEFFVDKGDEYVKRKIEGEPWFKYVSEHPEKIHKVIMKKDGKEHIFVLTSKKMKYRNNKDRYVIVFTDITEVENQRKKFQIVATTDPLVKIANRLKFDTILEKQMEIFKRYGQPFSLIYFDIDHFKKINDELGHKVGDKVLIELAKTVSEEIRKSDTFARWGGEEFVIIAPKTKKEKAYEIAEKLREKIQNHDFKIGRKVTCSFGVTEVEKGDTTVTIITRADKALYKAKGAGRNRVVMI